MKTTKSSSNVFLDLGFSPAEARNLRMRSQMITALRKFIEKERLTQADAAKRLKVTQPRISDLMRGRLDLFSLDALIDMAAHLDLRTSVTVRRRRAA